MPLPCLSRLECEMGGACDILSQSMRFFDKDPFRTASRLNGGRAAGMKFKVNLIFYLKFLESIICQ